jgi:hypothetical protein
MYQIRISTTQVSSVRGTQAEKVGNQEKECENCIRAKEPNTVPLNCAKSVEG